MTRRIKDFILSANLLAGTIIGAGVFSLPYVFKIAGVATGLFYLLLATVAYIAIYRMYAQVISLTPSEHRLSGYIKIYLGNTAWWISILMTIVGAILVLTVYLILSQSFGNLITPFGSGEDKMVIFWLLGSTAIFLSLRRIALLEMMINIGMVAIIAIIFFLGLMKPDNLLSVNFGVHWGSFLLPLAPVLFSLSGRVAIPAMTKFGSLRAAINWGTIVPAVLFAAFVLSILALSPVVTEDAVTGLVGYVHPSILIVVGIFGMFSILSSYVTIGYDVYKSLGLDLGFPRFAQYALVVFGPLVAYFAGLNSFIGLVSLIGGIFLGLEGIFIVLMWLKAIKKPLSLSTLLLIAVFAAAIIYEIIK
ncbi:MAG: hypothetical protein A3E64_01475 [Candidatus Harrisonbacteria bacterium RIFCSPHIGHO2_12_FULL_48_16]|uniref:Amino acid transporter transmembrane domain-containing protein n=1 Tax=Candidatus Harrisonbacteria bacterium RIFCSPHIGHO2_12_FULL_48_16 TaxID=1798405 RepID=A0A1G1ZKZ1_9BACT|nr:MAG: hypothetical protein A3E64_01475 [Candidatus Harrisonbacteria bacterium RIFCSPHIGHO2_12_FULL_48_16]